MAVRRGSTRLARRLRSERPEAAETLLELSVLGHLYRRGPMTPGALADNERLQPQSLTRALARLERDRLVLRRSDETDRRRSRLALTRDMARRDAWLAAAMARELTPTEQQLLRLAGDLMERLAEADDPGQSGRHEGS